MRVFILGLPRSGTQWAEQLVVRAWQGTQTLGEYFQPHWLLHDYRLEQGRIQVCVRSGQNLRDLHRELGLDQGLVYNWSQRLELVCQARADQGLVIRHFPRSRARAQEQQIVDCLAQQGFDFVSIEREFEAGLLSRILAALVHQSTGQDIWTQGRRPRQQKYYVNLDRFELARICEQRLAAALGWVQDRNEIFRQHPWSSVDYASMVSDLACALGPEIQPLPVNIRTLERDPYSYIENAEEVRLLIEPYVQRYYDNITL